MATALDILNYTREHGGGTFDHYGEPQEDVQGFVVGGAATELQVALDGDDNKIGASIFYYFCTTNAPYIGTWIHEGILFLDGSEVYQTREMALEVARTRGEIVIWDATNKQEILCEG